MWSFEIGQGGVVSYATEVDTQSSTVGQEIFGRIMKTDTRLCTSIQIHGCWVLSTCLISDQRCCQALKGTDVASRGEQPPITQEMREGVSHTLSSFVYLAPPSALFAPFPVAQARRNSAGPTHPENTAATAKGNTLPFDWWDIRGSTSV